MEAMEPSSIPTKLIKVNFKGLQTKFHVALYLGKCQSYSQRYPLNIKMTEKSIYFQLKIHLNFGFSIKVTCVFPLQKMFLQG